MEKYQIAVKSPLDKYVRSTVGDEDAKTVDVTLKRKWEDSGGDSGGQTNSSTTQGSEKKLKK